jgi:hypothetical protein
MQATNLQLAVGVAFVITANTLLSHWLAWRGVEAKSFIREFIVMSLANLGLVLAYGFLLPSFDGSINLGTTLFFALLLTLIVTMFDRYRQLHLERSALSGQNTAEGHNGP